MEIRFLGIRHHGPGSCRNVVHALHHFHPDLILLEGPPEAEPLLSYIADQAMKPPVALLAYCPDDPQTAVFYPVLLNLYSTIIFAEKNYGLSKMWKHKSS